MNICVATVFSSHMKEFGDDMTAQKSIVFLFPLVLTAMVIVISTSMFLLLKTNLIKL